MDELFGLSSGYVLDFTNSTFDDFFCREVGVDIYVQGPDSKEKRMRAFLIIGQPRAIVRALTSLREYRETTRISRGEAETPANARRRLSAIVERLDGTLLPSFDLDNAPAQTVLYPIALCSEGCRNHHSKIASRHYITLRLRESNCP